MKQKSKYPLVIKQYTMGSRKGTLKFNSVAQLNTDIGELKGRSNRIETDGKKLGALLAECIKLKVAIGEDVKWLVGAAGGAKDDISSFIAKGKEIGVDVSGTSEIKELQALMADAKEYQSWFNSIGTIPQV